MDLDETRRDILTARGHLLILGGPGCGKTTIALLKAADALSSLEPEQRVLFMSFSRAAVRQISERMHGVINRTSREKLEIRTFHSFFLELVRAHGPQLTGCPASFIAPDRERQLRADFTGDWEREARRLATDEGRYVFDRLAGTAALLLNTPAVRQLYSDTYPLIIVDEFQDTNHDQWHAVQAFSRASTIVCLADPDQRIFDFVPGVDERRIDHAVEHLNPTSFDLSQDNHRSPGSGLLDYANAVLRNQPATPPDNVRTWTYAWPATCEIMVHRAVIRARANLESHLGRNPSIAVLAPTNASIGRLSEAISSDQIDPRTSTALHAIDHELNWDPDLAAAAGYVVASIMEWPALPRISAITGTLRAITDFYRVKVAGGTVGARAVIIKIERALEALHNGTTVRPDVAKVIIREFDATVRFSGDPVSDWQVARSRLRDAAELTEIFAKARQLRLFKATDALAWALIDAWNGNDTYTDAAVVVRRVLASETLDAAQAEPAAVSLMNMHKSKGKEFDAVIIAEQPYVPLLDPTWAPDRIQGRRRLLRVAITRARHAVILVRPVNATPLIY